MYCLVVSLISLGRVKMFSRLSSASKKPPPAAGSSKDDSTGTSVPSTTAASSSMSYEDVPFLQIGDEAPDFTADSQVGSVSLHSLLDGGWGLLVFFSRDFDPVHTTELGHLCKLKEEFDSRQVKILTVSPDTKLNHQKWILEVQELQDVKISFPLICDDRADVCKKYGLMRPKDYGRVMRAAARITLPTSSLFVIDLDRRIRLIHHYNPAVGRNLYEVLRSIDALQTAFFHQVGTPCNWMQTEDVFVSPEVSTEAAAAMFPKGFMEIKPWFRLTPQPDVEEK